MIIVKDTAYNDRYPERPERFILTDDGSPGPTYFTAEAAAATIVEAEAKATKWTNIAATVAAME